MQLQIGVAAPIEKVWAHLSDIATHSEWMADAVSVEFLTEQQRGVGTSVKVMTRVGPLRSVDLITVTHWAENRSIGADHRGSVTGTARFELIEDGGATKVLWFEDLQFPWWMGGKLGLFVARPILRRIWAGNLQRFKQMVETGV
jgi:carbon monoxide dehydrogenase subunit G